MDVILLVEDNPYDSEQTIWALRELPMQIEIARTGDAALGALDGPLPDLILLDLGLPGGMSGLDLLRRLKAEERWRMIPVVVLTGSEYDVANALAAGAYGYIVKPVTKADLEPFLK